MVTTQAPSTELLRNRNKTVAKSFYRHLKTEGFSHEQIIELSATLLDLVNEDLKDTQEARHTAS
jgi:pyruvate-formate lyase-activating enzyme